MSDVKLEVIIPSAKVDVATSRFLRENPIPLIPDSDNTKENPLPDVPEYTIKRWVEIWMIRKLHSECEQGKRKLEKDTAIPEDALFI